MEVQGKPASPALKICGLTRLADVAGCLALGVDYLGFNLCPGSRRHVTVRDAAALWDGALKQHGDRPRRSQPVAVLVDPTPAEVAETLAVFPALRAVQLHGEEDVATVRRVQALLSGSRQVWKAAGVRSPEDVRGAAATFAGAADLVLLDTAAAAPGAKVHGGSGQRFDWGWLSAWPGTVGLGVAGGLTPDVVAALAQKIRPALVDVCSGVEQQLREKDLEKVAAIQRAMEQAW